MMRAFKTTAKLALMVATLLGLLPPVPAAAEFQLRAAVNDPKNEVVATTGASATKVIQANGQGWFLILPGQAYTLTVSGSYGYSSAGTGYQADAECTTYGDTASWTSQRFTSLYSSDLLDLKAGQDFSFNWVPQQPMQSDPACSANHVYTSDFVSPYADVLYVNFYPHDTDPGDNTGSLTITATRGAFDAPRTWQGSPYQCPKWSEQPGKDDGGRVGEIQHADVTVDSFRWGAMGEPGAPDAQGNMTKPYWDQTGHFGVYTCNWALPGSTYRIEVSGTYKYDTSYADPYAMADAECSTGLADPVWFFDRYPSDPNNALATYIDHMDVYIGGLITYWKPNKPDASWWCSTDHKYYINYSPSSPGPIHIHLYDFSYQELNNAGQLQLTIDRIG